LPEEETLYSGTDRGVLKQAELGVPVELIRQVGITEQTLDRWKKQDKGWRATRSGSSNKSRKRMGD
jgi:hypothetical protein